VIEAKDQELRDFKRRVSGFLSAREVEIDGLHSRLEQGKERELRLESLLQGANIQLEQLRSMQVLHNTPQPSPGT
jgi:acetolactate synthase small subunit